MERCARVRTFRVCVRDASSTLTPGRVHPCISCARQHGFTAPLSPTSPCGVDRHLPRPAATRHRPPSAAASCPPAPPAAAAKTGDTAEQCCRALFLLSVPWGAVPKCRLLRATARARPNRSSRAEHRTPRLDTERGSAARAPLGARAGPIRTPVPHWRSASRQASRAHESSPSSRRPGPSGRCGC